MSEPTEPSSATYERQDESKSEPDLVKQWLRAIELAGSEEKEWREIAEESDKAYRADKDGKKYTFNIYHSNIETLIPALRNSTPVPDIRRRHGDADPVAKMGADILERTISCCIDDHDFDEAIDDAIQDMGIAGRGLARVIYEPQTGPVGGVEDVVSQKLSTEHVGWQGFRHGPAFRWKDVPWIAFPHYLGREAIVALAGLKVGNEVKLDLSADADNKNKTDTAPDSIFKRTLIWEVWHKDKREVFFLAPSYGERRLKVVPDPLGLEGFFPVPRPMMAARTTGSLTPICLYAIYKELLEELDVVTRRIRKLVGQLRPRGLGPGSPDIDRWTKADDGDIVELSNFAQFLDTAGGLEKLIAWFPMEPTVQAVKVLYEQRESIKQQIFEVSGLADIMRGQTNPNETKGAQDLKSRWGSLRINRRQQEVQRFIRDIFRIKAEIIAKKYAPQQLAMITGLAGTPEQQQMFGQAIELLRQDPLRRYRIDVETDSTIRGDIARNMEQMTQFVQGSAAFFQAMEPAITSGVLTIEAATEIYSSFARQLRLGRKVEDILDNLSEAAKQPKPPKPDPEQMKAEIQGKLAEQKMALEQQKAELQKQIAAHKLQLDTQKGQMDLQLGQQKLALEKQKAELDIQIKMIDARLQQFMARQEGQIKMQTAQQEGVIKLEGARQDMAINREQARTQQTIASNKAQNDAKLAAFKAKQQAKQKPARQ